MPDRWKGILEEQGNNTYPSWYEVDEGSPKVNGYEEIPSPPGGASRWAEFEANAPVMEASTPYSLPVGVKPAIKELARRVGSGIAYGKDRAKQAINYGVDALAGGGGYSGYESTEGINELAPANTQNWWAYDTKRQDFQSDKDMPYSSYVYGNAIDPSSEYANFTDTDVYRLVNAGDAKVGRLGRAMGNVLNRLGGNFESTPDDDELTWRKALATAQGVQGYLGDTLPEQLEGAVSEGAARLGLATLSPWFKVLAKEGTLKDTTNTRLNNLRKYKSDAESGSYDPVFRSIEEYRKQVPEEVFWEEIARNGNDYPKALQNIRAEAIQRGIRPQETAVLKSIYRKQGKVMPRVVAGDRGVYLLDESGKPANIFDYDWERFPNTGVDPAEVHEAMIDLEGIVPPRGSETMLPVRPNYANGKAFPSEETLLENGLLEGYKEVRDKSGRGLGYWYPDKRADLRPIK